MKATVIAVLDDEPGMRRALWRLLRGHGYKVALFASGEAFLAVEPEGLFDCILLDVNLPEMSGTDVMRVLVRAEAHPPVIVITGHDEPGNRRDLLRLGVSAYLTKPVEETSLLEAIEQSLPGRAD